MVEENGKNGKPVEEKSPADKSNQSAAYQRIKRWSEGSKSLYDADNENNIPRTPSR